MISRLIYSLLLYLIAPFAVLRLYLRGKKAPAYRQRIAERFGFFIPPFTKQQKVIWVHSVSVGETIASAPLVKQLLQHYGDHQVLITTMTPTGSAQVQKLHAEQIRAGRIAHVYMSYDLPCAVARFLNKVEPVMAIMVDTELWPNTVAACSRRGIPVVVANARLSDRSAKGYQRVRWLTTPMLQKIQLVAAQDQDTAERFLALGLPASQCQVTGSIKFDLEVSTAIMDSGKQLRQQWQAGFGGDVRIVVAASTHEGEDQQVLDAFKTVLSTVPKAKLLLVPRHPERFDDVAELVAQNGLSVVRYGQQQQPEPNTQVILGDVMGEMMKLFAASDIAFVGGSFVATGGHNVLEPAALSLPVLSGSHLFNFAEISTLLQQAGGLEIVPNAAALAQQIIRLLKDDACYQWMSGAAAGFVNQNRGALDRLCSGIDDLLR